MSGQGLVSLTAKIYQQLKSTSGQVGLFFCNGRLMNCDSKLECRPSLHLEKHFPALQSTHDNGTSTFFAGVQLSAWCQKGHLHLKCYLGSMKFYDQVSCFIPESCKSKLAIMYFHNTGSSSNSYLSCHHILIHAQALTTVTLSSTAAPALHREQGSSNTAANTAAYTGTMMREGDTEESRCSYFSEAWPKVELGCALCCCITWVLCSVPFPGKSCKRCWLHLLLLSVIPH